MQTTVIELNQCALQFLRISPKLNRTWSYWPGPWWLWSVWRETEPGCTAGVLSSICFVETKCRARPLENCGIHVEYCYTLHFVLFSFHMSVLNVLAELPRRVFKCDGKWLAFSCLCSFMTPWFMCEAQHTETHQILRRAGAVGTFPKSEGTGKPSLPFCSAV